MIIFSFACLCSSLTHDFALSRDDYRSISSNSLGLVRVDYSLCDIVDDNCAVCVSVIHWCKRLVPLLACSIPYFELDSRSIVKGDGLCEEGSSDSRFSVVVELVLAKNQ